MVSIPPWHEIDADRIVVTENGDRLIKVDFANVGIVYAPRYFNLGIPGAIKDCYMRESVYQRLLVALGLLPSGLKFKVFDAWRPYEVQKYLYDEQVKKLCEIDGIPFEEAQNRAKRFVSFPTTDALKPFVHSTGGAIDLTITDSDNNDLNMGTSFDVFTESSATDSFEASLDSEVKENRRLLYSVMTEAGFTNYPSEWWHYDYGDSFWAAETNKTHSLFGGIYKV